MSDPSVEALTGNAQALVLDSETRVSNKRYTAYKVVVTKKGTEPTTLYKRYSEFLTMHEKLSKMFPRFDIRIPHKRRLGNNFDEKFIQARKMGLGEYLSSIVKNPIYVDTPPVREFLYGSGSGMTVSTGDDSVNTGDDEMDNHLDIGETERKGASLDDFFLDKVIGIGSFGKVLLAQHKETDEVFAIKVLSKKAIKQRDEVKHIMAERNVLLKNLKHPFLVGLHYSFQTPQKLYFVLDYVNGGELFFHLQREKHFSEPRTRFYASEITSAISFMHKMNIVYRDLKPENILLDSTGHIVLTDFGLCKENVMPGETTSTFCGTPEYLAPEVLKKQEYGRCVDWWCLGAVTYEMLTGLPPFYSSDVDVMYDRILNARLVFPEFVSFNARDLLTRLLDRDPRTRLGSSSRDAEDVEAAPFFSGIDWSLLNAKGYTPPFNPNVSSKKDLRHIDPEFVNKPIPQSVKATGMMVDVEYDETFAGFSYHGNSELQNHETRGGQ